MKNYKVSLVTRGIISSGMDLSQIYSSLLNLERLARKWATKLPKHLTWAKSQTRKTEAKTRIS